MRTAKLVRFSWAQTKSAFRLPVWNALLVSLTLAIIIASLLAAVGNRLERSLSQQTSELLGADLVVSSTMPISPERIAGIEANGFTTSLVTQFPTMLEAGDQLQMVSLRAVTNPYPLRGKIVTQQDKQSPIPNTGEIWVDASVTERMGVSLGDKLYAGYAELTISNVIESAPDRGRGFSTLNPQAIINQADLEETGLLGLGSRVRYRVLVSGEPNQVTAYAKQLETQLEHAERLRYANRTEGVASGALSNTSRYLRLGALIALLLSVFSIALSLRRFTESRNQRSAVLLSLGFSARQLQQLFSLQMLWAWLACSILASAIALGLEIATFTALSGVLPKPLPPINPWAYLTGPLLGFVTLFTLGLAPLAALSKVSVMQLFRKIQPPTQWVERALQGVALVAIAGVLAIYLGNIPLALLFLGGTLIAAGFIGWLGAWLLQLLATRLAKHKGLGRLLRSRLHQQRRWHRLQIPVMSLLLALIAVLVWARADLVDRWQNQLPTNTPNYFVINIQPSQIEGVRSLLDENAITAQLYPMVRGRITGKNGLEIEEAFTPEQQRDNSLHRELNLTWTDQLPEQTDIIEGQWPTTHNKVEVSVDAEEAQELGIKLGDVVRFNIASQIVEAEVTSLRSVNWTTFRPNFFFTFNPGSLETFPASYITSFYTPPDKPNAALLLAKAYPSLTLIDIRQMLNDARVIIDRLAGISGLIMGITLLAGVVLVFNTLTQELAQRRYETALMLALGASERQCRRLDFVEFGLMGVLCGVMAAGLTEIALYIIHTQLIQIDSLFHWINWLLLPMISSGIFAIVGVTARKRLKTEDTYQALKRL